MSSTRDFLIANIHRVFGSNTYPGDGNLIDRPALSDEPCATERDFLGKTRWQSLDSKFLDLAGEGWASSLSFFSAQAFRFYLPAYLIADLEGQLESQSPQFSLCGCLDDNAKANKLAKIYGGGTMYSATVQRLSIFTEEEAKVIVDYLRYKLSEPDTMIYGAEIIETGLREFWLAKAGLPKDV